MTNIFSIRPSVRYTEQTIREYTDVAYKLAILGTAQTIAADKNDEQLIDILSLVKRRIISQDGDE
jgi:hypothetical protein